MTEPYDLFTADLQTLERIERTTRNSPARALFEPLLLAQIKRTRELGQQPITPSEEPGEEWRHIPSEDAWIPEDAGPPDEDQIDLALTIRDGEPEPFQRSDT